MSQVKPKAEEFPTWADLKAITFVSAVAVFLAAVGHMAGHGSDCFVLMVAVLLLATLRSWEVR